jgi:hypothetical protein
MFHDDSAETAGKNWFVIVVLISMSDAVLCRNFIAAVPPTQQQDLPVRMLNMDVFRCQ